MLLQQAMFTSLNSNPKDNLIKPATSPSDQLSNSNSPSQMMDISPLERAFDKSSGQQAAQVNLANAMASAAAAAAAAAAAQVSADQNGNKNSTPFPFHPASLAAAFNLRQANTSSPSPVSSGSALNLSSSSRPTSDNEDQKSPIGSPLKMAENSAEENAESRPETTSKEHNGKSLTIPKFAVFYHEFC